MKRTPGWKMLEEELCLTLAGFGQKLSGEGDPKEVYRLQGRMKEINSILSFVKIKLDNKDEAKKELEGE